MSFVKVAESRVGNIWRTVKRVGDALIGGDFTGGARGQYALDLQVYRARDVEVASGARAVAVGSENRAAGLGSVGLGVGCDVSGDYASGLGYAALAEVDHTVNVGGAHIIRRGATGGAGWLLSLSGVETVLTTPPLDLKVVNDYALPLPIGSCFWINECGLILTHLDGLVAQPTVRFGINGTPAKHVAAVVTVLLTAIGKRERFVPLTPEDGENDLMCGVTIPANATTMKARFYWSGLLVQDETS